MATAEAIRRSCDALASPDAALPASLDAQAGLYRSLLAGKRMLVLLDNARDADQVRPLLPGRPGCLVIVTSRSQLTGLVAAEGAYPRDAGRADRGRGPRAADRAAGRAPGGRPNPAAAGELIRLCARLPLALSIAAARAASQPDFPLAALAADLRDAGGRLDALDTGDTAASVRAVFSWSYHQLDARSARVFRLLGLHPGTGIARRRRGQPGRACRRAQARQALGELARARLLAEHAPGRYAFHDLLRAYAAERGRGAGRRGRAARGRRPDARSLPAHRLRRRRDPASDPPARSAPRPRGRAPRPSSSPTPARPWPGSRPSGPRCWPSPRPRPKRGSTGTPGSSPGP